jgi:predicted transcriptional regulator
MEHLPGGTRQPYTTTLGLLQTMEKAGPGRHRKESLTHRYEPTVTEDEATGHLLTDFVARFFHGLAKSLILGLVDAGQLSPKDLPEIEIKLALQRSSPKARRRKRRALRQLILVKCLLVLLVWGDVGEETSQLWIQLIEGLPIICSGWPTYWLSTSP